MAIALKVVNNVNEGVTIFQARINLIGGVNVVGESSHTINITTLLVEEVLHVSYLLRVRQSIGIRSRSISYYTPNLVCTTSVDSRRISVEVYKLLSSCTQSPRLLNFLKDNTSSCSS